MAAEKHGTTRRWAARPVQALCVRAVVLLAPLAGSFAFVHFASVWLTPPASSLWLYLSWWFGLSAAATVVLLGVDRLARRLLPLSALLKLSLAFPDETPSRFKIALRSGSVNTLEKRLALMRQAKVASSPRDAAERLLELVAALNAHDRLTRGHSERVRAYSVLIGGQLGLNKHELDLLNWAALLHDIGKLEVRQEILTKPGKPSDEEWEELRQHPLFGERLTAPLSGWLEPWQGAVGYHHERWDGKGYPRGFGGEDIPIAGRIVAVADVFDVITSARSYKRAASSVQGRREIAGCAGAHFDPRVVRAFLNVSLGRMRMIMGPLSWLSHAPLLGRLPLAPGFGALAGTVSVVATAAASGTLAHPLSVQSNATAKPNAVAAPTTVRTRPSARDLPHPIALPTLRPLKTIWSPPRGGTPSTPEAAELSSSPSGTSVPPDASNGPSAADSASTSAVTSPAAPLPPPVRLPVPPPASVSDVPLPSQGATPADRPPPSTASPVEVPPTSETTPPPPPATAPAPPPPLVVSPATRLVFTTRPALNASIAAGASIPLSVSVEADSDLVSIDNTTSVTLSVASGPDGATLTCTNPGGAGPVTAVSGVASFTCSLDKAGAYTLQATDSTGGSGHPYTSATSGGFVVVAGAAAQLVFTAEPGSVAAGSVISPAVQVSVEDGFGNLVTGDNASQVSLALAANPGGGTLSGTLTRTVSAGVATFADLSLDRAGSGYRLSASSSPAYATATTTAFDVTAPAPGGETLLATNSGSPCTSGASCTTASIAPAAGATLLILAQRGGSTTVSDSVTSITGPLTGATMIASLEYPTAISRDYLFAWTATATGSAGTVTVNFAGGSNANPTVVEVVQLSGNNTTTPIAQESTATGVLGAASADLTAPNASNGELVLVSYLANAAITTPTGFTAVDTFTTGSNGGESYGVYFKSSAQSSTSASSASLGLGWGTIAIEINHA